MMDMHNRTPDVDSRSRYGKFRPAALACTASAFILAGCSLLPNSLTKQKQPPMVVSDQSKPSVVSLDGGLQDASSRAPVPPQQPAVVQASHQEQRVSNPQAREIRFDGQELVLGGGDCQSIKVDALRKIVTDLRGRGRHRSAREAVRLHRRAASQWVLESFAGANNETLRWVATTLDQNTGVALHKQLCDAAAGNPQAARAFDMARRQCLVELSRGSGSGQAFATLSQSAAQLSKTGGTLATIEAERLRAMSEITSGQTTAAAARFASTAETAAQAGSADRCAQLWLLASETHLRAESMNSAVAAWQHAVRAQLTAMTRQNQGNSGLPPLDTVFWERADRLRPPGVEFPQEVALAMNAWKLRIGVGSDPAMKPSASLWSAVATWQLTMGQPHLATLSIKRAEVEVSPAAKPWLRIALARSMAAQGQTPVATTILGSLTSDADARVRAASLAALGSIKVQAGAYEQGEKFLIQALTMKVADKWPGQLAAEADLANVRLIVGNLQQARDALHAVQQKLALQGRWQSLVHSLENEAAILDLERNKGPVKQVRARIAEIERQTI